MNTKNKVLLSRPTVRLSAHPRGRNGRSTYSPGWVLIWGGRFTRCYPSDLFGFFSRPSRFPDSKSVAGIGQSLPPHRMRKRGKFPKVRALMCSHYFATPNSFFFCLRLPCSLLLVSWAPTCQPSVACFVHRKVPNTKLPR